MDGVRWIVEPGAEDGPAVASAVAACRRHLRGETADAAASDDPWTPLKTGGKRTVFRRLVGDREHWCKLYSARWKWRLLRLRTPFRSQAAWAVHGFRAAASAGVRTVPLIAAGELDGPLRFAGRSPSFVVTVSTRGQRTLGQALRNGEFAADARAAAATQVRAVCERLHAAGVGCLELRSDNVLVDSADGSILLFDLDRVVRLWLPYSRAQLVRRDVATVDALCAELLGGRRAGGAPAAD